MRLSTAIVLPAALALASSVFPAAAAERVPDGVIVAQASADRASKIAAADVEIKVATDELSQARRRLEAGRHSTAKDRVNQLEGGGPMTDAYNLRVEALQKDVAKAQERLDRAITARKALDN
jgi:hypothetical protein